MEGLGILSDSDTSRGTRSSTVSKSGDVASGEKSGKVKLCNWRVWCARCVAKAVCAVISLFLLFVSVSCRSCRFSNTYLEALPSTLDCEPRSRSPSVTL